MTCLVLVGGGHAAGKQLVCEKLKMELEELKEEIKLSIHLIDMKKYQRTRGTPDVNFTQLIEDIEHFDAVDTESVVLVHGNYALYDKELRELANVKIFVDTDADARLAQWILRDVGPGKEDLATVLHEYLDKSRPEFIKYIQRTHAYADILLPNGGDSLGIPLIATSLADQIRTQRMSTSTKSFAKSVDSFDLRKEVFEEDLHYYAAI